MTDSDTPRTDPEALTEAILRARRIVVFTGAGVSTGAGIPDYRGSGGQYSQFQPVYYDEFLARPEKQREYWVHKATVWPAMRAARPGPAHNLCVALADRGTLTGVITQNVDGLHEKAGLSSELLVNLHGSNLEVECISCGRRVPAGEILDPLAEKYRPGRVPPAEDGPAGAGEPAAPLQFSPPRCANCGGLLKPATIMFGQSLRTTDLARAESFLDECDLFLVIGSTLTVQPAASLPGIARNAGADLAIITRGSTPLDQLARYRIDGEIDAFCTGLLESRRL
ncbi:MAG: SIR2 family NAD-dependent protein deacylase [Alkalispirochaeta sp.]